MSKAYYLIALVCVAAALPCPSNAQLATHRDLTYAIAKTIATTAVETCQAKGFRVSATVVDRAGVVVAQLRGDDAGAHTMENSRRKAYTALAFRISTEVFAKEMETRAVRRQQATLPGVIGIGGGLPIKAGEEVIGGVGVSGSPSGNDEPCVQAGLDKVADQLK